MDCIFCKINNKEIPGHVVYEDNHVLAFLDITQATKGHTLLIPKEHSSSVMDVSETTASHLFACVPKLSQALVKAFDADGINLLSNNGATAGQTVKHFHLHLIPRYVNDDLKPFELVNHMQDLTQEDFLLRKQLIIETLKTH